MSEFVVQVKESYLLFLVMSLCLTTFTNVVDFITGIAKAKAKGEKLMSGGFRRTTKKVLEYWLLQLVAFSIDCLLVVFDLGIPIATCIVSIAIILIEGKSIVENINERKGNAQEVVDMVAKIIGASNSQQAKEIIEFIQTNKKQ